MDRFEVGFNVDVNDEWPPVGVEFLWLAISSNGYQVLTAPFFLKDLSVGDILTIDLEQKGGQRFALRWSHLEKSSRSTVGVMVDEGVKIDDFLVAIEEAGGRVSHLVVNGVRSKLFLRKVCTTSAPIARCETVMS